MNRIVTWFVRNPVASNLLMIFIVLAGLLNAALLRIEVFPDYSSDVISIAVEYPGAAPEDVEEGICLPVEETLDGLESVKKIQCIATEGLGHVAVEIELGQDIDRALNDIKSRVDALDTLPAEAEKPTIRELLLRRQVASVVVHGDVEPFSLRRLAEQLRNEIVALPQVSQARVASAPNFEIAIEVSDRQLRRYGLGFDDVVRAAVDGSFELPGGAVESESNELLILTGEEARSVEAFSRVPLISRAEGGGLVLGDVADIYDTVADSDQIARFNGQPAVMVLVYRTADQNVIDVAEAVKAYAADRDDLPPGVQLSVWQDDTKELRDRLSTLIENGLAGFLLVLLMLAIFLRPKLALWVSIGLVIAFTGTLALMPAFGMSINSLSLFAFILVLGLLVDDAIVVGENIYRHYESGSPQAAIDGAREIAMPVLFSVLTTMVAFTPLSMVPGNAGKFLRILPVIVILALAVSLVESLLILPSHLSHLDRTPRRPSLSDRLGFLSLDRLARRVYLPLLKTCLRWRYAVLAGSLGSVILTFALVGGGHLKFSLFPPVESNNLIAFLRMAPGTSAAATGETLKELEAAATRVREAYREEADEDPFLQGMTSVGSQPFRELQRRRSTLAFDEVGSHIGEINLELVDPEDRSITAAELIDRWRLESPDLPGALDVEFTSELLSAGKAVDVQLSSPDFDQLHRASARVRAYLAQQPGVVNITDSAQSGKRRMIFELNARGRALGLTQAELARQIRRSFFGEDIQRFYRDGREVRVMVRLPESERASQASLDDLRIKTPGGTTVPLETVADRREDRSRGTVHRVERQRTVNVTADVDLGITSGNAVNALMVTELLDPLLDEERGLDYSMAGEQEEQTVVFAGLRRNFLLALFTMYALLAIFFRSYTQPLIVMSAIPFGFVGSVWAHFLLGRYFTILSVWGIVAVSGVVVNDSLVLIDRINKVKSQRLARQLLAAGLLRFRPILLTSITTFAGLTPLLLETSVQAQYLIPMAISVAFGVLFSTSMILIFVPSLYLILHDFGGLRDRIFRRHSAVEDDLEVE